jgi:hypothetical protein
MKVIDFFKGLNQTITTMASKWIPVAGSEVVVKMTDYLYYATVLGFFESDKSVMVRPHRPWPGDVLFALDMSASYDNTAKTWGSTSDKTLYVGDMCSARNIPGTIVDAKIVGIFPDDAVAIAAKSRHQLYLFRVPKPDVSLHSKGWGRFWSVFGL